MAKFYGAVGFVTYSETAQSVHSEITTEQLYCGDVFEDARKWDRSEDLNDDLNVANRISILADEYAFEHLKELKYVVWMGETWKITSFTIRRPRIIISIGGLYNGEDPVHA